MLYLFGSFWYLYGSIFVIFFICIINILPLRFSINLHFIIITSFAFILLCSIVIIVVSLAFILLCSIVIIITGFAFILLYNIVVITFILQHITIQFIIDIIYHIPAINLFFIIKTIDIIFSGCLHMVL